MLVNDGVDILMGDIGIHDAFRVDQDGRPRLAGAKATGAGQGELIVQFPLFKLLGKGLEYRHTTRLGAGAAGVIGWPVLGADEYMLLGFWHEDTLNDEMIFKAKGKTL